MFSRLPSSASRGQVLGPRVRGDDEFVRREDIPAASFASDRRGNEMCACPSAKAGVKGHCSSLAPGSRVRGNDDFVGSELTMTLTGQQALWLELMPFYIREAWLLDERRLKEWLDLFTEDVLYFMPRRKNVPRREAQRELTPLGDLAILEEDKRYLEMRVARLDTGMAWAEDPPSRTRHLIGNLEATLLKNGEVEARTAFLVYRSHLETDHQLLSGCRQDVLRKVNGAWKVARRTIVLDANVLLDKNLSVFF
jgi:3-phenylpropionate/cinnamic acid dioxygenase small subunit